MEEILHDLQPALILSYMAPIHPLDLENYSDEVIIEAAKNVLRGSDITKKITLGIEDAKYILTEDLSDFMNLVYYNSEFLIDYVLNNRQIPETDLLHSISMSRDQKIKNKIQKYIAMFPKPFYVVKTRWLPFLRESLGKYADDFFPPGNYPYVTLETFTHCIKIIYLLNKNPTYISSVGMYKIPVKYIDEQGQVELKDLVLKDYKQGRIVDLSNLMYSIGKKETWETDYLGYFSPWSFSLLNNHTLLDLMTIYPQELSMDEKIVAYGICKRQMAL